MKISIIAVGKVKEAYFRDGILEYSKRLSKYCKLELIEVCDEKTPDQCSEAEEIMIKEKESMRIQRYLSDDAYKIALAIDGKSLDSLSFASKINNLGIYGTSHIQFVIGGSLGLSNTILNCVNEKISFSKMTFPHQLMRVILLEQIYRCYRIMMNEPYHK